MNSPSFYRWPRRTTKRFALLHMLLRGTRVTHMSVLAQAHTYRAAAIVLALKDAGFPINADLQTIRDSNGHATRIAYYSIPTDELENVLADARRKGMLPQ